MANVTEEARRERAYQRLFHQSFKRMKKRGLNDDAAGQIAREVAETSLDRLKPPALRTEQEYSDAIAKVCEKLSNGTSHYVLVEEMPYMVTGRVDRVAAVAKRVKPPIDAEVIRGARKTARMERLSASLAFLFMGLALGTLGLWYAIAVGVVVAVGAEIYLQTLMPTPLRRSAANREVPLMVNVAAAASLV